MTVTDELLAELEYAAKEAHIARSGNDWFSPEDCCWWTGNADEGDFISTASPSTITALTAELRRLRAENAELGSLLREAGKTIHKLQAEQPTPLRIARYLDAMRAKIDTAMAAQ